MDLMKESETVEKRIGRLITENPVTVVGRKACCMCHVMKRLLAAIGVRPTVVELDDGETDDVIGAVVAGENVVAPPAVFIGGDLVGGLESLVTMHLGGKLIPRLREVGALLDAMGEGLVAKGSFGISEKKLFPLNFLTCCGIYMDG